MLEIRISRDKQLCELDGFVFEGRDANQGGGGLCIWKFAKTTYRIHSEHSVQHSSIAEHTGILNLARLSDFQNYQPSITAVPLT
jgi:hypothetical protein